MTINLSPFKGTPLWIALHEELWLNCSKETRDEYLAKMAAPTYFLGTIISMSRKQVELTVIPLNPLTNGPGNIDIIAISLDNMARFV